MARSRRSPAPPARKPAGRYHHGDLRRALLDTALRVVEEQGVEALSLRDLARRLGVSHAAPDHHFPDRLSLLVALAAEGYERLAAEMQAAVAGVPPGPGRLVAVGRGYLGFALEHPSHTQIMFGPEVARVMPWPRELQEPAERARRILDAEVEALAGLPPRACGAPRHPFVELHAFSAWALVHGASRLWIDGPMRASMARHGRDRAALEERALSALTNLSEGVVRAAAGLRSRSDRPRPGSG
jgi:AcrR family transcriptional regulator